MLITNLRDPATRRPQVVVGGLGTGKTTLLVQLTKLLAERGAVPVPISLRDAQDSLDLRTLALHRFLRATSSAVTDDATDDANAVRIWRQLCDEDKVVVLADGLEEALAGAEAEMGRDYSIRLAILQAAELGLPLIITSRPHDPLRQMPASIVQLEPLSQEAMLEHLQQNTNAGGRRLDWIVETADLAEAPVYLQITRQLDQRALLDRLMSRDGERRDVRCVDRAELRLRLLDTWIQALIDGQFAAGVALANDERAAIVEQLSVLACIGLQRDQLEVTFDDFENLRMRRHPVIEEAGRRLAGLGSGFDIRWAALRGTQLGLVEARGDGVLFQRPLLQAYLGSRLIGAAMEDTDYTSSTAMWWPGREFLAALVMHSRARVQGSRPAESTESAISAEDPDCRSSTAMWWPGREFLAALVMHFRARVQRPRPAESTESATSAKASRARHSQLQDFLAETARSRNDPRVLDLYAAALQIDCVDQTPVHNRIAEQLTIQWPEVHAPEPRSLEEAKLNLVHRFGEATRTIAERYPQGKQDTSAQRRKRERPGDTVHPAYRQLYRISYLESSNSIRVAGAQEIGAGGDQAFNMLEGILGPPDDADLPGRPKTPHAREGTSGNSGAPPLSHNGAPQEDHAWRELILRAWLAPLLAGSVTQRAGEARSNLERWLQFVGERASSRTNSDLCPSLEVALAQGFKYAANRRRRHPQAQPEARVYLVEQAMEMLRKSRFWFSQLTLLHALCLWELHDDGLRELPDDAWAKQSGRRRTDPSRVVPSWADRLETPHHPFISEALRLVTWALDTGLPERFIWIDERDVAARIGSYPAHLRSMWKHNLWIPPSTGWVILHPRAQKLLADMLLLLNMVERGQRVSDYSRQLQRINRTDLPPCLTRNRDPLDPGRTVGGHRSAPGSNCMNGCVFELCPYPPKREASFRIELSESFCLRQQTLISGSMHRRLTAPWQKTPRANLSQFWAQMNQRARG
jgi:NACHT domain